MANILEFLRGLLTVGEAQRVFRADPEGFITRAGFADLAGEDVLEAIAVLRRSLPPDVAAVLADFEDERRLPPVRPSFEERDIDAAVRQLHHAVDLVTGKIAPTAGPVEDAEPIELEIEPELVEAGPAAKREPTPPPHPETPAHHEPIAVEVEPEVEGEAPAPAPAAGVAAELADLATRLARVLADAERDVAALRAEAEAELERAMGEAERLRDEIERDRAELDARRAALREAEAALRERFSGLDEVFRSVLKDQ